MDRKLISCFVSSELRRQAGSLARGQDISSEGEEKKEEEEEEEEDSDVYDVLFLWLWDCGQIFVCLFVNYPIYRPYYSQSQYSQYQYWKYPPN